MALIHEKLYRSRDSANVDLGDYLDDLLKDLSKSYGRCMSEIDETRVNLVFKDSGIGLPEDFDLSKTDSLGL
jgi:two-component sensor histidine kinase